MRYVITTRLALKHKVPLTPELIKSWTDKDDEWIVAKFPTHYQPCWCVSWGGPGQKEHCLTTETGFWWDAMHFDTHGLYELSSFNKPEAYDAFMQYRAPRSAQDVIFNSGMHPTKYRQKGESVRWDGVVLAAQRPGDRSVKTIRDDADFWIFLEGACKAYGKHLFIKLHPGNKGKELQRIQEIARDHGVRAEYVNHSVLDHCKFCVLFCSTFSVDCFLREIPVVQWAPGYFYKSGAVTYANGEFPDAPHDTSYAAQKLVDFLVWRYCINATQPAYRWKEFFEHCARAQELFPVTEEFCYANNLNWSKKRRRQRVKAAV